MSRVSLVKTDDRKRGVRDSIQTLGLNPVKGKEVMIKPNFNTADAAPGSTDNQTLVALVDQLWAMGAALFIGLAGAFIPAHRALKLRMVDAVRYQ